MLGSWKTDLRSMLLNYGALVFYLKANAIWIEFGFKKSFPKKEKIGLSFIFLIRFSIPSQSFVYFVNTSLFLSVETKIKYLLSLLSSMYQSTNNKIQRVYTMDVYIFKILHCNAFNIINNKAFIWLSVYF